MVHFGRAASAPPTDSEAAGPQPDTPKSKPEQDLIIPPQFHKYCIAGLSGQVVLDIGVIIIADMLVGAFLYVHLHHDPYASWEFLLFVSSFPLRITSPLTSCRARTIPVASVCLVLDTAMLSWTAFGSPRPIDVLMKNALSGVAWFMLSAINGACIGESAYGYPTFVISIISFAVNGIFWAWTVWWGLNDRGPSSMYPRRTQNRCFDCRSAAAGVKHRRPLSGTFRSGDSNFSEEAAIQLRSLSNGNPRLQSHPRKVQHSYPAHPVATARRSMMPRMEPIRIAKMPPIGHRIDEEQPKKQSFESSTFTEKDSDDDQKEELTNQQELSSQSNFFSPML